MAESIILTKLSKRQIYASMIKRKGQIDANDWPKPNHSLHGTERPQNARKFVIKCVSEDTKRRNVVIIKNQGSTGRN